MTTNNLLRKQVISELRKRRHIFLTFIILSFIYLAINLFFSDMSLFKLFELNDTQNNIKTEIASINKQNEQLRTQIKLLKEDPFYREKLAREEFGLAKPDEYIFQYDR